MAVTIKYQLQIAKEALRQVSDTPLLEAEILLAHVLKKERNFLYTWPDDQLSDQELSELTMSIKRRLNREPIAYIVGYKEFWSLPLSVKNQVLIPRPETEKLIEYVLQVYGEKKHLKIADLGTGSGAIAIALAHACPTWHIYATDISLQALALAEQNAYQLHISNISFHQGSWCAALPEDDFDIIISNPPYITEQEWPIYAKELMHEPRLALVSGEDGLDAIREIIPAAKKFLKACGCLLIEHGFQQGAAVRYLFNQAGFGECHSMTDLAGQERITVGKLFTR